MAYDLSALIIVMLIGCATWFPLLFAIRAGRIRFRMTDIPGSLIATYITGQTAVMLGLLGGGLLNSVFPSQEMLGWAMLGGFYIALSAWFLRASRESEEERRQVLKTFVSSVPPDMERLVRNYKRALAARDWGRARSFCAGDRLDILLRQPLSYDGNNITDPLLAVRGFRDGPMGAHVLVEMSGAYGTYDAAYFLERRDRNWRIVDFTPFEYYIDDKRGQ